MLLFDDYGQCTSAQLPQSQFTFEEDARLTDLIYQHTNPNGTISWKKIAEGMPGRTAKQCNARYYYFMAPIWKRSKWTTEQDALLIKLYEDLGQKWNLIAQWFDGRNQSDMKNRYSILMREPTLMQTAVSYRREHNDKIIRQLHLTPQRGSTSTMLQFPSLSSPRQQGTADSAEATSGSLFRLLQNETTSQQNSGE
jgi:hypothetical protein